MSIETERMLFVAPIPTRPINFKGIKIVLSTRHQLIGSIVMWVFHRCGYELVYVEEAYPDSLLNEYWLVRCYFKHNSK